MKKVNKEARFFDEFGKGSLWVFLNVGGKTSLFLFFEFVLLLLQVKAGIHQGTGPEVHH